MAIKELLNRRCWCGNWNASYLFALNISGKNCYHFYRCLQCGVCFIHPTPDDAQLLRYYESDYYGGSPRKFIEPIAKVIAYFQWERARRVARVVPQGGRILDLGCGNGGFLEKIKLLGYEVEGTEWTEASANRVSKTSGITIHVGDLLGLDLPERHFDAVTMWHVLEHVRNPFETLLKVHHLLKDKGFLFLSLPNQDSWQSRVFGQAWFHLDPPRHLYGFGLPSLRRLLELSGFAIDRSSSFSMEYNPFGFMQSALNAVGFPRDRAYINLKFGNSKPSWIKFADVVLLGLLTLPGFIFELLSSCCQAGATLTVEAGKRI